MEIIKSQVMCLFVPINCPINHEAHEKYYREHPSKCISNGNGHSSVRTQVSRDSTSKQPSLR